MILVTVHNAIVGAYVPIQKGGIVVKDGGSSAHGKMRARNAKTI